MMNGANHFYSSESKHQIKKGAAGSMTLLPQNLPLQARLSSVEHSSTVAEGGAEDAQLFDVSGY